MRTKEEIANDLAMALLRCENHQCTNVANKTTADRANMITYGMELQQQLFRLRREEQEWIEQPE